MPVETKDNIVKLSLPDHDSSVEIHLFGAHVTSWISSGKERMFMSSKSALDGSTPVSVPADDPGAFIGPDRFVMGGIPIVFPVFGPPPTEPPEYAALKQHGFARQQIWSLDSKVMDRPEGVSVRFKAPPPPAEFKHEYALYYVVSLTKHQLSTDLHVTNTSKTEDFKFQALFHGYFAVPNAKSIVIEGLDKGVEYVDKVLNKKRATHEGGSLTIPSETDRVYEKVPSQEIHVDDGAGAGFKTRFRGFEEYVFAAITDRQIASRSGFCEYCAKTDVRSCVIWNPAEEKGKTIPDMEEGGWNKYICIEPGYVREFKTLKPGEEFLGQQVTTAL